jgi:translocation and assembly module TamB
VIRRLLTRLLYALLALFVVASAALYAVVGTAPGTRWLIDTVIQAGKLPLQLDRSRGSLLGGLDLYGIAWHDASATLRIAHASLRWRPLDLLAGRIHLDAVTASHIALILPENQAEQPQTGTATDPSIDLPLGVTLASLDVRDLIVVRGSQAWRIGAVRGHARLQGRQLHIGALHIQMPQGDLQLVGGAELAPPYTGELRLAWNWQLSDGTRLAGQGSLSGNIDRVDLVQRLTAPFAAQLHGHVAPRTQGAELTLTWQQAHWPLQGSGRWHSPQGTLQLKGTTETYAASLQARLEGSGVPTADVALQGSGDRHHFQLSKLLLKTLDGEIGGKGSVSWSSGFSWNANLHGTGINPGAYWQDWPGRLGFELSAEGSAERANVELKRLDGTLRALPFQASASAAWQRNMLQLRTASIQAGGGHLRLSGEADVQHGKITLDFDLPKVENLVPSLHGGFQGQARIDGPWNWPRITAAIRGRQLAWNGIKANSVKLDITPASDNRLDARLTLDGVQRGNVEFQRVQAQALGTPANQQLTLDATSAQGRIALAARGGLDDAFKRWRGNLNRLELAPAQGSTWRLTAPAAVDISAKTQQVSESCLRPVGSPDARFCLRLNAGGGKLDAAADIRALPLTLLGALLPAGAHLAGRIDGTAQLSGPPDALNGHLQLQLSNGELRMRDTGGEQTLHFAVPQVRATLRKGALQATARAEFPQQKASIEAQADIGGADAKGHRPLSGSLRLDLPDISALQSFTPQLHALNGAAQARLTLGGTLAQPRIAGTASLSDAGAAVLAAGIRLQHVQIKARLPENSGVLNFDAKADSGPGSLQAKGEIRGLDSGKPKLAMQVSGSNFEAVNLPQVQAQISPQLSIDADPALVKIRGKVEVPEAKIRVHRLPAKAVSISPDTVVVGQEKAPSQGPQIDAEVELVLGDKVGIDALGLNGTLRGNLLVRQQGGASPTADGTLNIVDGSYSAYGLKLTLSRGMLNFAGPVDNPGLDVVAQRQTGAVTAKLAVTGTLKSPRSEISADPPMSQADALSWLLTGHGINEGSRSDAALLLRAVYSMNVADNGGGLVSQLEQRTGLNEISVQGGDTLQQSALVLGKYLTPDIYVRYSTGLFERMNTLSLTYRLTHHLSVEAQSGASQALDLLYQIEFGQR